MTTNKTTAPAVPEITMGDGGIQINTLEDAYRYAKVVIASRFAPKSFTQPEQVVIAMQKGAEIGLKGMAALDSFAVINGRATLMGKPALGLLRSKGLLSRDEPRYGHSGKDMERSCWVEFGKGTRVEYTAKEAKQKGLWGKAGPWTTAPDDMLYWRAIGKMVDRYFSDAITGVPIFEVARDEPASVSHEEVVNTSSVDPPKDRDPILDALDVTPSNVESKEQESLFDEVEPE